MASVEMTCIVCPTGCRLRLTPRESGDPYVEGAECRRGVSYAIEELRNPRRVFTSTVAVRGGTLPVVPVRSDKPVPKSKLFECMCAVRSAVVEAPVEAGAVIVEDLFGEGIRLVATRDVSRSR